MNKPISYNFAVLLTCYNRKNKTLLFLESLFAQDAFVQLAADVYLLDDGSTDGTADAVKKIYPAINIIAGTGNLFWAGGMLKVWQYAITKKAYDVFLLFNDDVILLENSIKRLIDTYISLKNNGTVLIGSTLSRQTGQLTYGGHKLYKPNRAAYYAIKPDDVNFIPCQLGNANIFLVDKAVTEKIGLFADSYTHYLADFDYTLSAYKAGMNVLLAPGYYGYCENDHGVNWLSGKHSLKKRINYLYNVKGLAYREYLHYIKKHFPADYKGAFAKLWLKTLFPFIWDKFKRGDIN